MIPIFWGRAIQLLPVPFSSIYALSVASSSGDHGPFFTLFLSQQGALPIFFSTFFLLIKFSSKLLLLSIS